MGDSSVNQSVCRNAQILECLNMVQMLGLSPWNFQAGKFNAGFLPVNRHYDVDKCLLFYISTVFSITQK